MEAEYATERLDLSTLDWDRFWVLVVVYPHEEEIAY